MRPSRAATKIVSSPATVPATSGTCAASIASRERVRVAGRRLDDDQLAGRRDRQRPAPQRGVSSSRRVEVVGAGQRVDEPAVAGPHLDEAELRDVARDGRLDGVEALLAQRVDDLLLRAEPALLDEPENRALAVVSAHASTSSRMDSA